MLIVHVVNVKMNLILEKSLLSNVVLTKVQVQMWSYQSQWASWGFVLGVNSACVTCTHKNRLCPMTLNMSFAPPVKTYMKSELFNNASQKLHTKNEWQGYFLTQSAGLLGSACWVSFLCNPVLGYIIFHRQK